jgi:beta-galactosidase
MKNKRYKTENLGIGVAYYPEHWNSSLWEDDLKRMEAIGIKTIRIGEFAWGKIEASDGIFDFSFFDAFFDIVAETSIKVIIGTPSATPPAWLTTKYPEILNGRIDGIKYSHGMRRHYTYNAPVYRQYVARIVKEEATHFGSNRTVIGWQVDNEVNCETDWFFSEGDTLAFRSFLRDKYKSLEKLNEAWGTDVWDQTYTAWDEINAPQVTIHPDSTNPHRVLDYIRFISQSARSFVHMQSEILRGIISKEQFITTNGLFGHLDNHAMTAESLDFITYDSYPNFAFGLESDTSQWVLQDRDWSKNLAEARAICPVFAVMEQQSGAGGWTSRMKAPEPRPGQITLWAFQSISQGADFIGFYRWRTALTGVEQYWYGILDHCRKETRRYREIQELHEKFKDINEITGSRFVASFGILRDYDNIWDNEIDQWMRDIEQTDSEGLFVAAEKNHSPFNYVYLTDESKMEPLRQYPVLFYPACAIMTEKRAHILETYVQEGGTLVLGCRSALKDVYGRCTAEPLPGLLRNLTGVELSDFSYLQKDQKGVSVQWDDSLVSATTFIEMLETQGNAIMLGTYASDFFQGQGALAKHQFGKGTCYYWGSLFTEEVSSVFLSKLHLDDPYASIFTLPKSCEITLREKGNMLYFFLLNYKEETASVTVRQPMLDLVEKKEVVGELDIDPYGVKVLRMEREMAQQNSSW